MFQVPRLSITLNLLKTYFPHKCTSRKTRTQNPSEVVKEMICTMLQKSEYHRLLLRNNFHSLSVSSMQPSFSVSCEIDAFSHIRFSLLCTLYTAWSLLPCFLSVKVPSVYVLIYFSSEPLGRFVVDEDLFDAKRLWSGLLEQISCHWDYEKRVWSQCQKKLKAVAESSIPPFYSLTIKS